MKDYKIEEENHLKIKEYMKRESTQIKKKILLIKKNN